MLFHTVLYMKMYSCHRFNGDSRTMENDGGKCRRVDARGCVCEGRSLKRQGMTVRKTARVTAAPVG